MSIEDSMETPKAKEKTSIELPTREGYDRWSQIYDDEDNCLILLEEDVFTKYLGNPSGLRIADIGCGTGRHAAPLSRQGASVTGVDFSSGMLSKARKKEGSGSVDFVVSDLGDPLPLKTGTFHRVICCLVLDHIPDLRSFFGELGRICMPTGFIVVSVMHPALMLKGIQARFTDPASGCEIRPRSAPNQVSDYVMGAIRAGLEIEDMGEFQIPPALAEKSARAAKYLGWLMLLMMRLRPKG